MNASVMCGNVRQGIVFYVMVWYGMHVRTYVRNACKSMYVVHAVHVVYAWVHMPMRMCKCAGMCMYICVCIHIHNHAYIYIYDIERVQSKVHGLMKSSF